MSHGAIDREVRKAIMESVDRFCRDKLAPQAQRIDDDGVFPLELYREFAALGVFGLWAPEDDGGVGQDLIAPLKISERLARHNVAFAISVSNCGDCIAPIVASGSAEIKARYLARILAGEIVPAFCLSEPSGAFWLPGDHRRGLADWRRNDTRTSSDWTVAQP